MSNAFLTGSRVYGSPTPASDYDLVIRISNDEFYTLLPLATKTGCFEGEGSIKTPCITIGKLSLICCTTDDEYDMWKRFTEKAKQKAPLTKKQAIKGRRKVFGDSVS